MLNNEVRLIGIITTDFEDNTYNENYPKVKFTLEVEKKSKGKYCNFVIEVMSRNREIDTSKSLKGQTAIVTAYVDEHNGFIKLVAQEIDVIGFGRPKVFKVEPPAEEENPMVSVEPADNSDDIIIPDGELPF